MISCKCILLFGIIIMEGLVTNVSWYDVVYQYRDFVKLFVFLFIILNQILQFINYFKSKTKRYDE